jgi:hypothetical protein
LFFLGLCGLRVHDVQSAVQPPPQAIVVESPTLKAGQTSSAAASWWRSTNAAQACSPARSER